MGRFLIRGEHTTVVGVGVGAGDFMTCCSSTLRCCCLSALRRRDWPRPPLVDWAGCSDASAGWDEFIGVDGGSTFASCGNFATGLVRDGSGLTVRDAAGSGSTDKGGGSDT